jgi:antagonist of KipI
MKAQGEIKVVSAGFLTTVQDLGRRTARQFGVTPGGALDRQAMRVANILAGNDENAAGIEVTFGGMRLEFSDTRFVAWCGAHFSARIGDRTIPAGRRARIAPGESFAIGPAGEGCRGWLAIAGGIDLPLVLGSRATDLRGGFGGLEGRALSDGDRLPLGSSSLPSGGGELLSSWAASRDWISPAQRAPVLRIVRGTDWHRFDEKTLARLTTQTFQISAQSDRMGLRLEGSELARMDREDLISEAVTPGTIQVPPSGQPIVLLGDCQTVGGYPKIAHVITVDLPFAAQLHTGNTVRFREISLLEAHRLWRERERDLAFFKAGVALRSR